MRWLQTGVRDDLDLRRRATLDVRRLPRVARLVYLCNVSPGFQERERGGAARTSGTRPRAVSASDMEERSEGRAKRREMAGSSRGGLASS